MNNLQNDNNNYLVTNNDGPKRLSISEQIKLKNIIANFNQSRCRELFEIIKKKNIPYSSNKNGVFLNFKNVSNKTLIFIKQYVDYYSNIESWSWDFGDGNFSLEKNPVHTYNFSSIFNISFEIESSYGCKNDTLIYE